ncbi:hypothetical protein BCR33DRAFT_127447 [Rhizoclosmatium globosum]|uniref:Uncharacterized protein n=1 Tax=Rhizoclosmatium globosum TaxID=329046 RepID=A0A1Y2CHF1_9FUNG|nr:hypothetical protein BCR33DRAFT_127447 [Rhizoclosmatium globosum]|eukprot:ORY46366.1 hypothetical protein BCR33DRAFT_127447 [Rhizoclosmatium globosum]
MGSLQIQQHKRRVWLLGKLMQKSLQPLTRKGLCVQFCKSKPVSDSKKPGQPDDSGKSKDSAAKQQEAVGEAFKAEAEAGESAANKKVEGGKGSSSPKKAVDGQGKGVNEPAVAPGKDAASKEAIDAAKEHEAVGEAFKAEAEEKVADKKGKGSKETIPKVPTVEVPGDSAVPDASNKDIAAAKKHEAVGEAFKAEAEGKTGAAVNDKSGNGADKKVTDGSKGKSESFSGKVGELVDAKDASAKQDKDKNTASKSLKVETTVKASESTKGTGGKVEKPSKANGEAIGDIEGEEEVYGEEDVSDEAVAKSKAEGYVSVPKNGGLYERKRRAEAEVNLGSLRHQSLASTFPLRFL